MSTILDLYPRAWRERYGDELAALLEEQPATLFDDLDLIRGAIDARLHPQVPDTRKTPEKEIPMNTRLLGVLAAIGGIAWLVAIASLYVLPLDFEGNRDTSVASIGLMIGMTLTGIALGELGSRRGSTASARAGHVISVVSLVMAGILGLGWPLFVIPLFGFPVVGLIAAARGWRNEALPRWVAVAVGIASIGMFVGFAGSGGGEAELVLIGALGMAALALGWVAVSGRTSQTPEIRTA